jgi:hypothetical protein
VRQRCPLGRARGTAGELDIENPVRIQLLLEKRRHTLADGIP